MEHIDFQSQYSYTFVRGALLWLVLGSCLASEANQKVSFLRQSPPKEYEGKTSKNGLYRVIKSHIDLPVIESHCIQPPRNPPPHVAIVLKVAGVGISRSLDKYIPFW